MTAWDKAAMIAFADGREIYWIDGAIVKLADFYWY